MEEFWNDIVSKGTLYLIGQIIGVISICLAFVIYTQKDRKKLVIFKLVADVLSVVQYAFSGTYAGATTLVVMCFRDFIFIYRGSRKWADHIAWLFVFEIFIFVSPFITTKEPPFSFLWYINIMPALGSGIATVGLYNKKVAVTKVLSLICVCMYLIYVVILKNYIQIFSNAISIISLIIGLVGEFKRKKKLIDMQNNAINE